MPSKSKKQHNLMAMVAHDKKAAKRLGISQKVGKEFMKADKGKKFASGGMSRPAALERRRQQEYLERNPQYKEREKGLEPVPVELLALGGGNILKNLGSRVVRELLTEGRVGERTPTQAASQIARRAAIEKEQTEKKAKGGKIKSKVNQAGNYTKPGMRKSLFESIKSRAVQGTAAGQWSARKAQLLAKQYKAKGGGYRG